MLFNLFRKKGTKHNFPKIKLVKNDPLNKVLLLLGSFFLYGLIYFFFCYDTEFKGINMVQDKIREDTIDKYVEKVKKHELTRESEKKIAEKIQSGHVNTDDDKDLKRDIDPEIVSVSRQVTDKSQLQEFYDRFYFAVVTGTTLGYGDIQPASNKVKFLTLCQLMTTIYILFI